MTSAHLVLCPSCARHVRVSEAACPFCGTGVSEATRGTEKRRAPTARLSRAALYAFGVGTVAVAAACSSSGTTNPGGDDSGASDGQTQDEFRGQPAYGIAIMPDGGEGDVNTIHPAYGIAIDAGEPGDAGEPDVTIQPAYGIATQDGGHPDDAGFNRDAVVAAYGGPGV
jgi:hypothetical protein